MGQLDDDLAELMRGVEEAVPEPRLRELLQSGRTLKIKAGFDPTAPDLHLGHTVLINKLRQFQDLGHTVYFLIGDFTAMIGDPSGKNATRPALSADDVRANARTYEEQIYRILDPDRTRLVFNSEWMGEMGAADLIQLASRYTVARMLERDDFNARYASGSPIAVHEFLYPLIQGYDSVALEADVELGGTDQRFNLLMGRELQRQYGQEQQMILTLPLLVGLDGQRKMSKSLDNYVGIQEPPHEVFGKLMSVSDDLMWEYYRLLSRLPLPQLRELEADVGAGRVHPRDAKERLALELTARFHGDAAAAEARDGFAAQFRDGGRPSEMESFSLTADDADGLGVAAALRQAGLVASNSDGLRMIRQGAVRLDDERVDRTDARLAVGADVIARVGKRRYARIHVAPCEDRG